MPKRGSSLDLPIAVGLLRATGSQVRTTTIGSPGPALRAGRAGRQSVAFAWSARVRACRRAAGPRRIVVAPGDAPFAALGGIAVLTLESVTQFVRCGPRPWDRRAGRLPAGTDGLVLESDGMRAGRADPASRAAHHLAIAGLAGPRRAVHLAAAGGHSCCFLGPPGVGKSMLARSLHALLQQPAESELVQIVAIATAGNPLPRSGGDLEQQRRRFASRCCPGIPGRHGRHRQALLRRRVTRATGACCCLMSLAGFGRRCSRPSVPRWTGGGSRCAPSTARLGCQPVSSWRRHQPLSLRPPGRATRRLSALLRPGALAAALGVGSGPGRHAR